MVPSKVDNGQQWLRPAVMGEKSSCF